MPNRLAQEISPYLLQHADNPVDWYPWTEEALAKAQREQKPIFLSIGYSACHWCHVMAHESFEDPAVAALLNAHFVNIKVDREERPDLDQIYMSAVQTMTGRGGWPMSVFITPEGVPFYGGTYFPPTARFGMPSFSNVLQAITDAWQQRRDELIQSGKRLVANIARQSMLDGQEHHLPLAGETITRAMENIEKQSDHVHGGWGDAPKFPQPMVLDFLLRTGSKAALEMVNQTLIAMARGGMYDQLGGGFHRYSVDDRWLVPHFEKMLYDNAQLAQVYLHAWQVTGTPFFRTITQEILDYVIREMTDPAGGFYATQDADSEGVEGKFFVWDQAEIQTLLGEDAPAFMAAYGVTEQGNFEGQNILEFVGELAERPTLATNRATLAASRARRIHPGRDEKVLTAWNGMMLAAFAEAARVLARDDYRQVAERNAAFLLDSLRRPDGRLLRSWKDGQAKLNGYLEDYTHLIKGLLELYQTTFDAHWFTAARELADLMITHFNAPSGFYDTSDDHETLITRPRDLQDNATPSGNAMAATVLGRLAGLAVEPRYRELAEQGIAPVQSLMGRFPLGFAQWLIALDFFLADALEIAIVGDLCADDTRALLTISQQNFRPHQVVAAGMAAGQVPLLAGRAQLDDRATAYVCRDFTCRTPLTDPAELAAELQSGRTTN